MCRTGAQGPFQSSNDSSYHAKYTGRTGPFRPTNYSQRGMDGRAGPLRPSTCATRGVDRAYWAPSTTHLLTARHGPGVLGPFDHPPGQRVAWTGRARPLRPPTYTAWHGPGVLGPFDHPLYNAWRGPGVLGPFDHQPTNSVAWTGRAGPLRPSTCTTRGVDRAYWAPSTTHLLTARHGPGVLGPFDHPPGKRVAWTGRAGPLRPPTY